MIEQDVTAGESINIDLRVAGHRAGKIRHRRKIEQTARALRPQRAALEGERERRISRGARQREGAAVVHGEVREGDVSHRVKIRRGGVHQHGAVGQGEHLRRRQHAIGLSDGESDFLGGGERGEVQRSAGAHLEA